MIPTPLYVRITVDGHWNVAVAVPGKGVWTRTFAAEPVIVDSEPSPFDDVDAFCNRLDCPGLGHVGDGWGGSECVR